MLRLLLAVLLFMAASLVQAAAAASQRVAAARIVARARGAQIEAQLGATRATADYGGRTPEEVTFSRPGVTWRCGR